MVVEASFRSTSLYSLGAVPCRNRAFPLQPPKRQQNPRERIEGRNHEESQHREEKPPALRQLRISNRRIEDRKTSSSDRRFVCRQQRPTGEPLGRESRRPPCRALPLEKQTDRPRNERTDEPTYRQSRTIDLLVHEMRLALHTLFPPPCYWLVGAQANGLATGLGNVYHPQQKRRK